MCCEIVIFLFNFACSCSASTFAVPSLASSMSSSIIKSNCSGICTFDADLPADTLGPVDGGCGGPELVDAVYNGAWWLSLSTVAFHPKVEVPAVDLKNYGIHAFLA